MLPSRRICYDVLMDVRFAATAFATAITIIDPIGMIPMTLGATARVSPQRRNAIIDQAVLVAGGVMLVMGVVGQAILNYLGITLPAFMIAGGILLFLIAIDMLFARPTGAKRTEAEEREAAEGENPAVFPLAIPMISGPGTIATVLLLVNLSHGDRLDLVIVAAAYAAALLVTWLCMRGSSLLLRVISNTGIHVTSRILGIILAALAVQFVLNGLSQTPLIHHAAAAEPALAQSSAVGKSLFCAHGSIEWVPASPPPGFESEFAVAVVEITTSTVIENAGVTSFALFNAAGKATTMKRVVKVETFDEPRIGDEGSVAYYLNTADDSRSRPWNGTLPAGTTRLRVRVALAGIPDAPVRYAVTIGPYEIGGPCDIAWPT